MATQTMAQSALAPATSSISATSLRTLWVPATLLLLSILTTACTGARFFHNFELGLPPVTSDEDLVPILWALQTPAVLLTGWMFSMSLLGILIAHEMGHYVYCRVHNIKATLPLVLPAPTLSGTAGALIRIKSRIPSRNALMDVGAAGPLAGYLVCVPVVFLGLLLSRPITVHTAPALIQVGEPAQQPLTLQLAYGILHRLNPGMPGLEHLLPHPILIAGWVGLLITSLNLLPAGQLDGGHILYSLSPRLHGWMTNIMPLLLFIAGAKLWVGWLLWGIILLLPAMRHPRVPTNTPLSSGRILLGFVGFAILVLTLTPVPFADSSLMDYLR